MLITIKKRIQNLVLVLTLFLNIDFLKVNRNYFIILHVSVHEPFKTILQTLCQIISFETK